MTGPTGQVAPGSAGTRASLVWLIVVGVVLACDDSPRAPDREPHVRGWITRMRVVDSVTRLLVEEFPDREPGSAQPGAKVELVLDPLPEIVVVLPDGRRRHGDIFDLNLGARVRAWIDRTTSSDPAVGNAVFVEVDERR